jgi:hypothetical protein
MQGPGVSVAGLLRAVAPGEVESAPAGRLEALLDAVFLAEAGWDPGTGLLLPPADHPLLGWPVCRVPDCANDALNYGRICAGCRLYQRRHSLTDEQLVTGSRLRCRPQRLGGCTVPGCPRPWTSNAVALCEAHGRQRKSWGIAVEEFIASAQAVPLPSFGRCEVIACRRERPFPGVVYCDAHYRRLQHLPASRAGLDEATWRAVESAVPNGPGEVNMRGLPPLVAAEILYGLQQRTRDGFKTRMGTLRRLCDRLRRHQVRSVTEAPAWGDKIERGILNTITAHVLAAAATPDTEVARDVWRLRVFGMHGAELDFRPVTQPWLREAGKRWAASDLPGRRGTGHSIASVLRAHVAAVTSLSESLRGGRSDHGDNPALLGRADIDHFVLRQQYLQNTGSSSGYTRERNCRMTRIVLTGARGIGLMRPGGPTAGLREDFTLGRSDMPAHPQPAEPCRDLPPQIMRQLCERLAELEGPVRVAVELLIDTGRRPAEICGLAWDCLARDDDGSPVLVYDNRKPTGMAGACRSARSPRRSSPSRRNEPGTGTRTRRRAS